MTAPRDGAPGRVPLPYGHHLRPLRPTDTAADLAALTGSPQRLGQVLGEGLAGVLDEVDPTLLRACHAAVVRHRVEQMAAGRGWTWLLLDDDETAVLGRVEIQPADGARGRPYRAQWFVVDECAGTDLERAVAAFLPEWLRRTFGVVTVAEH